MIISNQSLRTIYACWYKWYEVWSKLVIDYCMCFIFIFYLARTHLCSYIFDDLLHWSLLNLKCTKNCKHFSNFYIFVSKLIPDWYQNSEYMSINSTSEKSKSHVTYQKPEYPWCYLANLVVGSHKCVERQYPLLMLNKELSYCSIRKLFAYEEKLSNSINLLVKCKVQMLHSTRWYRGINRPVHILNVQTSFMNILLLRSRTSNSLLIILFGDTESSHYEVSYQIAG